MFRKLIFLALVGAGAAYVLKQRSAAGELTETTPAPAPRPTPEAVTDDTGPALPEAEAQAASTAVTTESDAVVPDTSADDPLVQEQEDAAAEEAGAIGGSANGDAVESEADAEETLEKDLEEEGR